MGQPPFWIEGIKVVPTHSTVARRAHVGADLGLLTLMALEQVSGMSARNLDGGLCPERPWYERRNACSRCSSRMARVMPT